MDGERYFVLQDDAMVSMRYARNLAEGRGRVWNPGVERVEGYTNPLWTLYMSLLQLAGLTASKVSLLVQISGALMLAANLVYVRRIAALLSGGNDWVSLSAALLTAFYLPLNNWSMQGMEVGPLTLLVRRRCMEGRGGAGRRHHCLVVVDAARAAARGGPPGLDPGRMPAGADGVGSGLLRRVAPNTYNLK